MDKNFIDIGNISYRSISVTVLAVLATDIDTIHINIIYIFYYIRGFSVSPL